MQELALVIVRGIGEGAVFALVAMSFNVVFNATGILNFAQGVWVVVGGLFAFLLLGQAPSLGLWLALGVGVALAVALLLIVQGSITLYPLKTSVEQHSWLVTTLAAAVMVESLILILQGPAQIVVRSPFGTFPFLGVRHPFIYLLLTLLAFGVFLALRAFHSKTLIGLTMSALRQDLDAARAAGAQVRMLQLLSFALSGAIVGLTGFVGAPVLGLTQASGVGFAVDGFIAAVVGGLGNQSGAMLAGPAIGMLSVLAVLTVGGEFERAASLGLLIVVLLTKPEGIFGRPTARRI